jgi:hypothetical protein
LEEFDVWRPGYGFATVTVLIGGTTSPASIFLDQDCTQAATNPQTLLQQTQGDISYGKWAQPLYTQTPYFLQINDVDETGVVGVPLTTLVGQDASLATVIPTNASVAGNLDDILARTINVLNYGPFLTINAQGASATTNTNSLVAAIAQAAANGGGEVELPDGTFGITSFTIPPGVIVVGQGGWSGATVLQSTSASAVVTVSGNEAGLKHLCLDGLSQVTNSIGLYARLVDQVILEDVLIKRFDFGIQLIGGNGNHWKDVWLSDCEIGYQGEGNSLVNSTNNGGPLEFCRWDGGIVDTCTTVGIQLECIDDLCDHHAFAGIQFNDNTGIAFEVIGARDTLLQSCAWNGNTTDLQVQDGAPINTAGTNTVIGFECQDGSFIGTGSAGSAINLSGTLSHVAFRRCEFTLETITLTTPGSNVLEEDCRQISGVTFAGTATNWIISKSYNSGKTIGLTTGNAATVAWGLALNDGQYTLLKARVVARSRSNTDFAFFEIIVGAYCTGATLDYDAQTANFTAGDVVSGATSGATARILAATNSGATGSLTLQDVNGTFLNNEALSDTGAGAAIVNGTITHGTATLDTPTSVHTTNASSFACAFAVSAQEVFLHVTGLSSTNVEWFCNVDVISSQQIE